MCHQSPRQVISFWVLPNIHCLCVIQTIFSFLRTEIIFESPIGCLFNRGLCQNQGLLVRSGSFEIVEISSMVRIQLSRNSGNGLGICCFKHGSDDSSKTTESCLAKYNILPLRQLFYSCLFACGYFRTDMKRSPCMPHNHLQQYNSLPRNSDNSHLVPSHIP